MYFKLEILIYFDSFGDIDIRRKKYEVKKGHNFAKYFYLPV
jgi:hypothetical protein